MPVLPKSLLVLGTRFHTALAARRWRQSSAAGHAQQRQLFSRLLPTLAATQFGRDTGLDGRADYGAFRARVPLRSHDQLSPWIERMVRGEADVLWPGRCSLYALSSGTTTGRPRRIPVTEPMLAHYRQASQAALLCYTGRVGRAHVMRGRHLLLGDAELGPLNAPAAAAALGGPLDTIVHRSLPRWAQKELCEPATSPAQSADPLPRLAALAARARKLDLSLISGSPTRLLQFAEAVREGAAPGAFTLRSVWPSLECIVHTGALLGPYQEEIRRVAGAGVRLHEVYAMAEGIIAAQDAEPIAGLRLLSDARLFFEFLPQRDYDPALPAGLGARAVPLGEVRPDEDYVLVLTTPAGLCRYVCGDVVRFLSIEPPRLVWVGRAGLQLAAFGENLAERDLTDALVSVCQRHAWSLTTFHVAPVFVASRTGTNHGGHEWWIELRPGTVTTPTGPLLAGHLDQELTSRHETYRTKRRSGAIQPPVVRLVMPGFFAHWRQHHAPRLGVGEMPRCRGDRQVADSLTALACFHPD